jgi:short-subunit dehydrogenase
LHHHDSAVTIINMKQDQVRRVLILGASGGIGSAIARKLAHASCELILADRDTQSLETLTSHIRTENLEPTTMVIDLENEDHITGLCTEIADSEKGLDWIIFSAGYIDPKEKAGTNDASSIQRTFTVNTTANAQIAALLTPILRTGGGMIHLSSTAGLWGNGAYPVYSASKAAINTYSQALARRIENERLNLTSIALCPGPTNTAMRELIAGDADKHQDPEVIADLVYEIVNGTSLYKNGDILVVRDEAVTIHTRIDD